MYAIAGVTGHTGSVVASTLLAQGKKVRVIVRDAAKGDAWKAKGAEVAVADVDDEAALVRAFTGVAGAFVLLPPDLSSADPLALNLARSATLARAATTAKLPHAVLLSSVGAQHASGTGPIVGLHRAENDFVAAGVPLTAIRAAFFQENWSASLGMLAKGVLPTFLPKAFKHAEVATADIGRAAAGALIEGVRGPKRVVELAGPRDISPDDIATELSALTGRTITASEAPLDAVVPTFISVGISAGVAELYREMYAGIASGHVAPESTQTRGSVDIRETLRSLL